MTTTSKPRPARRRKTKPMTTTKVEPKVVLPKLGEDIIPFELYVKDIKNRWKVHLYEIDELSKDIRWTYNKAKPYIDKVVARLSPEAS